MDPGCHLCDQHGAPSVNRRYPLRPTVRTDLGTDPVGDADLRCTKSGPPVIHELVEISIKWRHSVFGGV